MVMTLGWFMIVLATFDIQCIYIYTYIGIPIVRWVQKPANTGVHHIVGVSGVPKEPGAFHKTKSRNLGPSPSTLDWIVTCYKMLQHVVTLQYFWLNMLIS